MRRLRALWRSLWPGRSAAGRGASPDRLPEQEVPAHVAVVMDGNGRWAQKRHLPRTAGHRAGAENLHRLCQLCIDHGIRYVTVYAFSTENWQRPTQEVEALMDLFVEFFNRYDEELAERDIRLRFAGERDNLPERVRQTLDHAEQVSAGRTSLQLIVAFNYGGRRELVQAMRTLARAVASGQLQAQAISEETVAGALYLPDVPDPDLLIRPSGEMRLSNFLLWQAAYSELWFSDVLWPDFGEADFVAALKAYAARERRYGGVDPA